MLRLNNLQLFFLPEFWIYRTWVINPLVSYCSKNFSVYGLLRLNNFQLFFLLEFWFYRTWDIFPLVSYCLTKCMAVFKNFSWNLLSLLTLSLLCLFYAVFLQYSAPYFVVVVGLTMLLCCDLVLKEYIAFVFFTLAILVVKMHLAFSTIFGTYCSLCWC